jgi:hypothetical protein
MYIQDVTNIISTIHFLAYFVRIYQLKNKKFGGDHYVSFEIRVNIKFAS